MARNTILLELEDILDSEAEERSFEPKASNDEDLFPLIFNFQESEVTSMAESGSWTQYQKLVLRLLEEHDKKLEALQEQINSSSQEKTVIAENIKVLKDEVNLLLDLVRDGSVSAPAILSRIDSIENQVQALKQIEVDRKAELTSLKTWKRSMIIAVTGVVLSVGWDIIQYFLPK